MLLREYNPDRDKPSIARMWQEVGWVDSDRAEWLYTFLELGLTLVVDIDGQAESLAQSVPGVMRYLDEDLPFGLISAVTTSHVARKRGAPKRLVARALAHQHANGALVAGLGMFDQGFYNQVGFGTGGYEHWVRFDPAGLRVSASFRVPRRLTVEDWPLVHASRAARQRLHGGCTVTEPGMTHVAMQHCQRGFGLGYCDGPAGELTHHLFFSAESMGSGPYHVQWMAFQTREQFLELMALVKSLSDQVKLVTLQEPPGLQVQDLLDRPFRHQEVTEGSRRENRISARAWWQMRILDLSGCLAHTHLGCTDVRFNLQLTDPLATLADEDLSWRGLGGEYVVTLGSESHAKPGTDSALPTLQASVGAFTRMWLGVHPATGLAYTDELTAPGPLLAALDAAFRLPEPKPDWDF